MRSRPGERERSKAPRRLLAAGFTLAIGYTFGIVTLGGCAGAPWPSNGKLPGRVVDRLTECGKKGPTPLTSVNYDLAFTVHVTADETEARVDDVMLTDSTVHLTDVEDCMTDALYGMRTPLEALALRRRKIVPDPIAPETRPMLGQAEATLLLQAGAVIVVGFAVYYVVVHIVLDKPKPKRRPQPVSAEPAVTEAPVASAAPTTTAVPIATAVPTATTMPSATTADDEDDPCMALQIKCLENKKQPAWNVKNFGPEKNCKDCYRECRFHSKPRGTWPDYKCPRN